MNANIKDIIDELDRIDSLLSRLCDIDAEIDTLKEKNTKDSKQIVNEYRPELPSGLPVFRTLIPELNPFASEHAKGIKIGLIGFAVSLLLWLISSAADWYSVIGYSFIAMIVFIIWFVSKYKKYVADKKKYLELANKRSDFKEIIKNSHAQDILDLHAKLNDYYTKYQLYIHKFSECYGEYVDAHNTLVNESDKIWGVLAEVTLLSEEHIFLANRISNLLKSGRAETLKEALNLAIAEKRDEDFKSQQLAEEARRTQIAQQQAYDNMLHNQRMEQEAAAQTRQAEAQSRIAEAQLRATEKQNTQLNQILANQNRK